VFRFWAAESYFYRSSELTNIILVQLYCAGIRGLMMASILTVDDSTSMRQMVLFTLKGAGYEVVEAADGVEALEVANTRGFDLVVTDVNMPNMDGITLIKELRNLPDYKFTPILMLTTESGSEKKQEGKAAGATGWIVKPFDPERLLDTIKKVLG
jgi:two-component system, chemotaxis family, chemotaxis protein CheY